MSNTKTVKVVRYKDNFFLWFGNTAKGMARLLTAGGVIYSGTPAPSKLQVVREIPCKEYNNYLYFQCKLGVFSCSSGKRVESPSIIYLFNPANPVNKARA